MVKERLLDGKGKYHEKTNTLFFTDMFKIHVKAYERFKETRLNVFQACYGAPQTTCGKTPENVSIYWVNSRAYDVSQDL